MIDFKTINGRFWKKGAYIEDGTIVQYETLDLDAFDDDVRKAREIEEYNGCKDFRHVMTLPYALIHEVRREHRLPNDRHGFEKALGICKERVRMGQYHRCKVSNG